MVNTPPSLFFVNVICSFFSLFFFISFSSLIFCFFLHFLTWRLFIKGVTMMATVAHTNEWIWLDGVCENIKNSYNKFKCCLGMFYLSLYNQHKSHKSLKIKQKELSTVCLCGISKNIIFILHVEYSGVHKVKANRVTSHLFERLPLV